MKLAKTVITKERQKERNGLRTRPTLPLACHFIQVVTFSQTTNSGCKQRSVRSMELEWGKQLALEGLDISRLFRP